MRLGDFELRREVGRGGMGTVYEAWQHSLQRVVALKLLAPHISSSPKAIIRFQREAQAAAKLHHQHIVPIFAQGEVDGNYFYAMEFVSGESLSAIIGEYRRAQNMDSTSDAAETIVLQRGADSAVRRDAASRDAWAARSGSRLPHAEYGSWEFYQEATRHIAAVADALEYAHQQGVIHRDIKPHNLILGEDGRMRVSDFGLARVTEQPGVTVTGELLGSPLYMSPEQISGDASKIGPTADIYSLGATFYEWLTLVPPYPGETREQVIGRILSSEALPLRSHNPEIPLDLETIALKAIDRDPRKRYRTAGEFRDDLRRFLSSKPIVARRAGLGAKTVKFVRRRPVAVLSALLLIVGVTLTWAALTSSKQAETDRAAAIDATAAAAEAEEQNALLSGLVTVLQANPVTLAEAAGQMIGDLVPKDAAAALTRPAAPGGGGSAPNVGTPASIAFSIGCMLFAPPTTSAAENPAEATPAAETSNDGAIATAPAAELLRQAAELWSGSAWSQVVSLLEPHINSNPLDFSAIEFRMAALARLHKYPDIIAATGALLESPFSRRAFLWRGLANVLLNQPGESLVDLTQAMIDPAQSRWATVIRGLAWIQMDRESEAIKDFDAVLTDAPDFLPAHLGKASALLADRRYEEAVQCASRALELESANVDALTIRGDGYFSLGNYVAAERDYREAIDISGRSTWLYLKWWPAYQQRIKGGRNGTDSAQTSPTLPNNTSGSRADQPRGFEWPLPGEKRQTFHRGPTSPIFAFTRP